MTNKEIEKEVRKILLAVSGGTNPNDIAWDESLIDMGLDSLDFVEVIMNIERDFNIVIPDVIADKLDTLRKIVSYIDESLRLNVLSMKHINTNIKQSKMATLTTKTGKGTVAGTESAASKIDYVFPGGQKFSGTFEELEKVATALGLKITGIGTTPRGYYPSDSKGMVKIATMNEFHIRRALLKRSKDYFAEVFDKEDTNRVFLQKYMALTDDSVITDLFNELKSRA